MTFQALICQALPDDEREPQTETTLIVEYVASQLEYEFMYSWVQAKRPMLTSEPDPPKIQEVHWNQAATSGAVARELPKLPLQFRAVGRCRSPRIPFRIRTRVGPCWNRRCCHQSCHSPAAPRRTWPHRRAVMLQFLAGVMALKTRIDWGIQPQNF